MPRKLQKPRPAQGARLATLRKAAGLSQAELGRVLGISQANIAFWEKSEKPPRSDVLPAMAKALGVRVEELLGLEPTRFARRPGPVGSLQRAFDIALALPRRQQQLVVDFVATLAHQQKAS